MKTIIAFISLFLVASIAGAADTSPAFGDIFNQFLTSTIFPVFGALVLGFASWALKKVGDKFKIAGLDANNGFLMTLAAQGIAFAEEKAANFAKNQQPLSSNEKLNSAIAYLMQHAPKITEDKAQSLVTAALACTIGVGATGTKSLGCLPNAAPPADPPPVTTPAQPVAPLAVAP